MYNQQQQAPFVQSQYRGFQQKFQPTGPVQSFYQAAAPTTQIGNAFQSSAQNQPFQPTGAQQAQYVNPQSFHTANYRGNQAGHDNYLRADSVQPTSGQFAAQTGYQAAGNQFANQAQESNFHAANYRGNQAGHDNYLRADSVNPSANFSAGAGGIGQYQAQNQAQIQAQAQAQNQQAQYQAQAQAQNPQSFHAANYVGNQAGHDNYLRADSTNPSSYAQFGAR